MEVEEIKERLASLIFDYQMIGENLDNESISLEAAGDLIKQKEQEYEILSLEIKDPKHKGVTFVPSIEAAISVREYVKEKFDAEQNPPINF